MPLPLYPYSPGRYPLPYNPARGRQHVTGRGGANTSYRTDDDTAEKLMIRNVIHCRTELGMGKARIARTLQVPLDIVVSLIDEFNEQTHKPPTDAPDA